MLQHQTRSQPAVSPEDHEDLCRFLSHASTPRAFRAIAKRTNSPVARYLAVVDFLRTAIELAGPLPPALRRQLRPWLVEIARRRQQVFRLARWSGARWRRVEQEEAQRRQVEQEVADLAGEKGAAL